MSKLEIYGAAGCPYTQEMREWLAWLGHEFDEYDVERDGKARERLRVLAFDLHTVPVLVEGGKVVQVGWQGLGCTVD